MTIKRKVRCKYHDSLECFIIVSTEGDCKHVNKHYKTMLCNLNYCAKTGRKDVFCERVKGKKKCKTKKKNQ
jgi:hypothetical protein